MKNLLLLVFTFTIITLDAQTNYNCYHLQEFLWNSKTQTYDIPVEKNDNSVFYFNNEKKTIQQVYDDGTSNTLVFKSVINDNLNKTITYHVKSPVNGYNYLYKINLKSLLIEIYLNENNQQTILKKYLFKY